MPIKFKCSCGKVLSVPESMAGKKGKCPGCGKILIVPESSTPSEEPEEATPRRAYKGPDLNFAPLIIALVVIALVIVGGVIFLIKKRSSPEGAYNRAMENIQNGNYFDAEDQLKKILEKKPDYAEAYAALGRIFTEQGKSEEALKQYRKALEVKPDFAPALERIGMIYLWQNNIPKATETYKALKEIDEKLANMLLEEIKMASSPPDDEAAQPHPAAPPATPQ